MDYESNIRNILLRYPRRGSNIKVFINPSISGCDEDFLSNSNYISVDSPDEADYIPVWIDYQHRCSDEILKYIEQYPNKCVNVIHFIDSINVELDEISENELTSIFEMLSSPDWKSIQLGLTLIRAYYITDDIKKLLKSIIDTVSTNAIDNSASVCPLNQSNSVIIENLDLIKFYYVWLHNEILKI